MKKIFCIIVCVVLVGNVFAHDFSAVAPSGQTLYYNLVTGGVSVTCPGYDYSGYTRPTGNLTIPSTVSYGGTTYSVIGIGSNAFQGCSGLTSITIPNSVTYIDNNVFYGCSGLTSVTIPNSVTHISEYAFSNCSGLTSVTIPNSVTYIGFAAFSGCSGLTSVIIPNSVTSIGPSAFSGCSGLTSVTIPNSVTSIGNSAFYDCSGLTTVNYTGTIEQWCNITFEDYGANPVAYSHSLNINGNPITNNLVIPNSVTSIGHYSFSGCSGLTSVIIPNSVTSIGHSAFSGCSGLTSVTIPNSVTSIYGGAFANCTGLTSVTFNATNCITTVSFSDVPFYGCSNITTITIGNNVTIIPDFIFSGCNGLTSVTIPNSVTRIGVDAFNGCSGLTSVTIPNSVASIGSDAFSGCSGLTEIHSEASVAPLLGSTGCFAGVPINIPVYIPCGSQLSYYSRWSYFSNFVEAAGFSFSATSADDAMGSVTVLTQPTCQSPTAVINATPAAGYLFQQWNNGVTDNPYSLVVTSDTALSAIFVSANDTPCDTVYIYIHDTVYIHDTIYITGEGIGGADAMNAKVYTSRGQIVVEGADGNTVTLYDLNGRMLATKQDYNTAIRFDAPASGTYMIKIGNHTARKVVVVR